MITGNCFTNLDRMKKEEWPKWFVALPRKGDFVKSRNGVLLRVVCVIHTGGTPLNINPSIEVELHNI